MGRDGAPSLVSVCLRRAQHRVHWDAHGSKTQMGTFQGKEVWNEAGAEVVGEA